MPISAMSRHTAEFESDTIGINGFEDAVFDDSIGSVIVTTKRPPRKTAPIVEDFVATITTDDYWDIDGVPMCTPAWNIEELDGATPTPAKRGQNLAAPYHSGQLWRPKQHDAVTRSLMMWISWKTTDGAQAATRELRQAQYQANEDYLKGLLIADPSVQHTITRRVFAPDGSLVTRTFLGEVINSVQFAYMENSYWPSSQMQIDFLCADPYWYGEEEAFVIGPPNTPTFQDSLDYTSDGQREVTAMTIRFAGPLDHPLLSNFSFTPDVSVRINRMIATNEFVDLDTDIFTAFDQSGVSAISDVTRFNSREWFRLLGGVNHLVLASDTAQDGIVTITQKPVYL